MTPIEQDTLVAAATAGNRQAQAKLLAFCERDIQAIVRKVRCTNTDREDLAQVARLTILKNAIPRYKAGAGKQFRFYAAMWVRTETRRAANVTASMVTVNMHHRPQCDVSLDAPVGDDGESMVDLMRCEEESPETVAVESQRAHGLRAALESIIETLNPETRAGYDRQALARDLVYNRLLSPAPEDLEVFAVRHGIVRETVRKLETKLLKKVHRAVLATA